MYLRTSYANLSSASCAASLPFSAAASRSRKSEETPSDRASTPDFLLSMVRQSSADMLYLFMMNCATQVSISPARVPIGTPASGDRPMEVSWHLPSLTADRDEPLPRWQDTTFSSAGSRPRSSAARRDT